MMRFGLEEDNRTIYCGNLSESVTESILFELFQQAGPVESVRRPRDPNGRPKSFAFIVFKHECSIPYALEIFRGTKLFNKLLNMNSRSTLRHVPVLDTHITEFTEPRTRVGYEDGHFQESRSRSCQEREDNRRERNRNEEVRVQDFEHRMYQNVESNRGERNRSDNDRRGSYNQNRHARSEKDANEPTSWAEFNALHGKNLVHNNLQSDLQGYSEHQRDSRNGLQTIPDIDSLLQMGQQMLMPYGLMGMGGVPYPNMMLPMGGVGPNSHCFGGNNVFPSMEYGNERRSSDRDIGRRDSHSLRESGRSHPYNDQGRHGHRDEHRRHDRGYSSSRSSHDRERRDRRSR